MKHRTGWSAIDKALDGGFKTGELVLFTGKSGSGKTAAAMSVVKAAAEENKNVFYFTNDATDISIMEKVKKVCGEEYAPMVGVKSLSCDHTMENVRDVLEMMDRSWGCTPEVLIIDFLNNISDNWHALVLELRKIGKQYNTAVVGMVNSSSIMEFQPVTTMADFIIEVKECRSVSLVKTRVGKKVLDLPVDMSKAGHLMDVGGYRIRGLKPPLPVEEYVTKAYVDSAAKGHQMLDCGVPQEDIDLAGALHRLDKALSYEGPDVEEEELDIYYAPYIPETLNEDENVETAPEGKSDEGGLVVRDKAVAKMLIEENNRY